MVQLAVAAGGGGDTGAILRAAAQITPKDTESYINEFKLLADKMHEKGVIAEQRESPISARDAYFSSSAYYRAADFYLNSNLSDPRINEIWNQQLNDFNKAVKLLPKPAERANLNGTGFTIPVYFYPADARLPLNSSYSPKSRVPTVIVGTGYDGPQQDLYHLTCRGIIERGWNCITYEGPGQPTVIRQQKVGFIPEWWQVIAPIVDYLHQRKDVDVDRIALIGVSFGGLLAPLAATREHRLAAVVANDGLLNMQRAMMQHFPSDFNNYYRTGNREAFNRWVEAALVSTAAPTSLKWFLRQGMLVFNTTDAYDSFDRLGKIYLTQEKLNQIKCPVFVASGEDDGNAAQQPEEMARMLGDKATYHLFKTDVGAGEHCSIGAEKQISMEVNDWLGEVFGRKN